MESRTDVNSRPFCLPFPSAGITPQCPLILCFVSCLGIFLYKTVVRGCAVSSPVSLDTKGLLWGMRLCASSAGVQWGIGNAGCLDFPGCVTKGPRD